jgi:hypothetical protein
MPMPTISARYADFTRIMVRLLARRACDCELHGLEAMLARANAHFVAALPHLEQMERGCTRSDLGQLQCALIDNAGQALFGIAVAVANEVGMSLTAPRRLERGCLAAYDLLQHLAPFLDEADAAAHVVFMSASTNCDGENAADDAS